MPAQTDAAKVVFYVENDTAPPLEVTVCDSDGNPISLTGATVKLYIAHQSYDYYYSPKGRIVDGAVMTNDPDQVTNKGKASWSPPEGVMSPAGSYQYRIEVTYGDGTHQMIPPNTTMPLVIRATVGGN